MTSDKRMLIGGGIAVALAAAIGILFVAPAEFGWDPTGAGKAMGLSGLSEAGEMTELERGALREGVLTLSKEPVRSDRWQIVLRPFESVEFKYTLAEGAPMVFAWRGTGQLHYDMHSHPFEGGTKLTESYGVADQQAMQGLYIAPFTGIHGWYWQNRTMDDVTLTLEATGAFTTSTIFDQLGEHKRPIPAS